MLKEIFFNERYKEVRASGLPLPGPPGQRLLQYLLRGGSKNRRHHLQLWSRGLRIGRRNPLVTRAG
jgi:hypothetical protein